MEDQVVYPTIGILTTLETGPRRDMPVAHRPPTSPHVFALANVERTVSMCQNVDTSLSLLSSFGDTKSAKWAVAVPVQRQVISVFVSGLRHIFNDVAVAVALRLDAADSGERESPKFALLGNDLVPYMCCPYRRRLYCAKKIASSSSLVRSFFVDCRRTVSTLEIPRWIEIAS